MATTSPAPLGLDRITGYLRSYLIVRTPADEEWLSAIAARWAAKDAAGETSCCWHEAHEYNIHHGSRHACAVCGFESLYLNAEHPQHELCRLRAEAGRPTPPLDDDPACPCARCRR
jgi:hypothetical protein